MSVLSRYTCLLFALACFLAYSALLPVLYSQKRGLVSSEMEVALPRFVQVLMAAGDRFLAANIAGFRALVVSTDTMSTDKYHVLGLVQSDAAWLNPAHEDNYYIAAAILPWNGEVAAAQYVLKQATFARVFDWQPPFYYGFNALHFFKDPTTGGEWMRIAAEHTQDEMEQIQLQQLAANSVSKGDDIEQSIRLHRMMAKGTRHKSFARFLEKRAVRLENLQVIKQAATRYREVFGRNPYYIQDLVDVAYLATMPRDPFDMQYALDGQGRPFVLDSAALPISSAR